MKATSSILRHGALRLSYYACGDIALMAINLMQNNSLSCRLINAIFIQHAGESFSPCSEISVSKRYSLMFVQRRHFVEVRHFARRPRQAYIIAFSRHFYIMRCAMLSASRMKMAMASHLFARDVNEMIRASRYHIRRDVCRVYRQAKHQ